MDNAVIAPSCSPALPLFSNVGEDIVNWAVFADDNDIEGLRLVTESGLHLIYRANWMISSPDPPAPIGGRIIGFRV